MRIVFDDLGQWLQELDETAKLATCVTFPFASKVVRVHHAKLSFGIWASFVVFHGSEIVPVVLQLDCRQEQIASIAKNIAEHVGHGDMAKLGMVVRGGRYVN